jgi:septal ring factor EnvC (AmiA/AmiB activator)
MRGNGWILISRHGSVLIGVSLGLALAASLGLAGSAAAQQTRSRAPVAGQPSPPLVLAPPSVNPAKPTDSENAKARADQLETVRGEQRKAAETQARLKREIESIGDDRSKLNQQLIDTASRIRVVEDQTTEAQERLAPLDARERTLRQSLEDRRGTMAEVLAALQRVGRHPPPALMVTPEDALQSVRSAMLLAALLPDLRHDADLLMIDLAELARIRKEIAEVREGLTRDLASLAEERERLSLLIEERQKQQAATEQALEDERARVAQLARQAETLKDLMARLDQGVAPGGRSPQPPDRSPGEKGTAPERSDLAALKDPGRLAPAIAFAAAKGKLPLPANGVKIKDFGAPDGAGGTQKGITVLTHPGAQITAPCDGWVVYAGTFRNYGQLLILNAGSGYHVLLAGMDRISVDLGQFVVTGEPVAVMGGGSQVAAALADRPGQPVLYVEFRKDGTPVDPSPWWATSEGQKVRG